jgi:hypothetical protein
MSIASAVSSTIRRRERDGSIGRTVLTRVYANRKATATTVRAKPSTRSGAARTKPTVVVPHRMIRIGCRKASRPLPSGAERCWIS